jgi:EAL domain-containing protein (putative c-di-GMP-specific phosphodiesterase class I)
MWGESKANDVLLGWDLLEDLRAGRIHLAFQPVFRLREASLEQVYSEAFVRRVTLGTEESVQSCYLSIGALERIGAIARLDLSVLWTVVRLLEEVDGLRIGCNVSARSFATGSAWSALLRHLSTHRHIATRLAVEVSESNVMDSCTWDGDVMNALRRLGVAIAIDDVGLDYGPPEVIRKRGVDIVKIDRSVIIDDELAGGSRGLLASFVAYCHLFVADVVVEGVESASRLSLARASGATGLQGGFLEMPSLSLVGLSIDRVRVVDVAAMSFDSF